MFLIHRPSLLGIMLGKTYLDPWYKAPEASELERFYSYVYEKFPCSDDFVLFLENTNTEFLYTTEVENGFRVFQLSEDESSEQP